MKNTQAEQNNDLQASYNSQFAVTLRGLLAFSPRTGERTTYKTLAEHLNVKQQSVSSWANGTTIADTKHIAPLADYFGVTCDYLLGREPAYSHAVTNISDITGLAPEAVDVLKIGANNTKANAARDDNNEIQDNYEIKALNHLIANCNSALLQIGLYLFAEIDAPEKAHIKHTDMNLSGTEEYIRRGMLTTLNEKLMNYRKMLTDNGGDLPLRLVLDDYEQSRRG
jgi:transcriptional regulator with XRE-family HTH domain